MEVVLEDSHYRAQGKWLNWTQQAALLTFWLWRRDRWIPMLLLSFYLLHVHLNMCTTCSYIRFCSSTKRIPTFPIGPPYSPPEYNTQRQYGLLRLRSWQPNILAGEDQDLIIFVLFSQVGPIQNNNSSRIHSFSRQSWLSCSQVLVVLSSLVYFFKEFSPCCFAVFEGCMRTYVCTFGRMMAAYILFILCYLQQISRPLINTR